MIKKHEKIYKKSFRKIYQMAYSVKDKTGSLYCKRKIRIPSDRISYDKNNQPVGSGTH